VTIAPSRDAAATGGAPKSQVDAASLERASTPKPDTAARAMWAPTTGGLRPSRASAVIKAAIGRRHELGAADIATLEHDDLQLVALSSAVSAAWFNQLQAYEQFGRHEQDPKVGGR